MAKTFWSVGFIVMEAIKSLESWQQKRYSWISLVKVIVSFLRIVSWRIVCWLISLFWGMFLSSLIHTITLSVRSDIHLTLGLYHFFSRQLKMELNSLRPSLVAVLTETINLAVTEGHALLSVLGSKQSWGDESYLYLSVFLWKADLSS